MQHLGGGVRLIGNEYDWNMKKIVALLFVAAAIVGCAGYMVVDSAFGLNAKSKIKKENTIVDSSGMITREFRPGSFDKIEVEGPVSVEFTQGKQGPVVVTAPSFEMEYLEVEVSGSTLEIEFDDEYFRKEKNKRGRRVTVKISAPSLREIDMSLSSSFVGGALKQTGNLEIDADTSASIEFKSVECGDLSVDADTSGSVRIGSVSANVLEGDADTSGSIRINGKVSQAMFKADTSGSIKANTLTATKVSAKADTSGSVEVETLTADEVYGRADTSGLVSLKGVARTVDLYADTSGRINAGELKADHATVGSETGGKVIYCAKNTKNRSQSLINTYKVD